MPCSAYACVMRALSMPCQHAMPSRMCDAYACAVRTTMPWPSRMRHRVTLMPCMPSRITYASCMTHVTHASCRHACIITHASCISMHDHARCMMHDACCQQCKRRQRRIFRCMMLKATVRLLCMLKPAYCMSLSTCHAYSYRMCPHPHAPITRAMHGITAITHASTCA
jgi:hypothetical protein